MTEVYLFLCLCVVHLSGPDFDAEDGFIKDTVSDVFDLALKAKLSIEGIFDTNWQSFVEGMRSEDWIFKGWSDNAETVESQRAGKGKLSNLQKKLKMSEIQRFFRPLNVHRSRRIDQLTFDLWRNEQLLRDDSSNLVLLKLSVIEKIWLYCNIHVFF